MIQSLDYQSATVYMSSSFQVDAMMMELKEAFLTKSPENRLQR